MARKKKTSKKRRDKETGLPFPYHNDLLVVLIGFAFVVAIALLAIIEVSEPKSGQVLAGFSDECYFDACEGYGPLCAAPVASVSCSDPRCNTGPCVELEEDDDVAVIPADPTAFKASNCPEGTLAVCPLCVAGTPVDECQCSCTYLPNATDDEDSDELTNEDTGDPRTYEEIIDALREEPEPVIEEKSHSDFGDHDNNLEHGTSEVITGSSRGDDDGEKMVASSFVNSFQSFGVSVQETAVKFVNFFRGWPGFANRGE